MYVLKLKDKEIQLRWGLWAQREYCRRKGINTVSEYAAVLGDGDSILNAIPDMILLAAEYACIKAGQPFNYTEIDVCEWIDEIGGYADGSKVFEIFRFIVGNGQIELSDPVHSGEEKKT